MMNKLFTILFAYMLSVSSAFAAHKSADDLFAAAIASEQGIKTQQVRVIIVKGKEQLAAAKESVRILSIRLDKKFDNFYASASVDNSAAFEVNGKYEKITRVPVLSRKLSRDEIITASDITYIDINEKAAKRGVVTDEKQMLGKGVAKTIFALRPVYLSSITSPKFISRGGTVKTIFRNNLLSIESSGVALEDGAEGDYVRVKNPSSNRIIRGLVTAENTVLISDNKQLASND